MLTGSGKDADLWSHAERQNLFVRLLGLPFLVLGLLLVLSAAFSSTPAKEPFLGFLAVLPFLAVGIVTVFGMSGFDINRRSQTFTNWWGLSIPLLPFILTGRKSRPLSEYDRVEVYQATRGGPDNYRRVHVVRLTGVTHQQVINEFGGDQADYLMARGVGEKLARFCQLNLSDHSHGPAAVRAHDMLDLSLRARMQLLDKPFSLPTRPKTMCCRVEVSKSKVLVELPSPRPLMAAKAKWAFRTLALSACALVLVIAGNEVVMRWAEIAMSLAIMVTVVGILNFVRDPRSFRPSPKPTRVLATAESLTIEHGRRPSDTVVILTDQLEELLLSDPPGSMAVYPWPLDAMMLRIAELSAMITARNDQQVVSFGRNLPYDELKYVYSVLLRILTASPSKNS